MTDKICYWVLVVACLSMCFEFVVALIAGSDRDAQGAGVLLYLLWRVGPPQGEEPT